jgi:xanthine dehydrogenase small subunit
MRDHLLLYLNGHPLRVAGEDAFLPLSDYLRRRQNLTGTKVVCAEGDCGSCAALVGRINETGQLTYAAVTSCIQLMFQLDAAHVVTIEGLKHEGRLNPIQQSMVDCHGAQCGFCTPGFVVALYDLLHDGLRPCDPQTVTRALVGNLCRCTGYSSIIRAACETDRTHLKPIDALYPPAPIAAELSKAQTDPLLIDAGDRHVHHPVTIEEAARL